MSYQRRKMSKGVKEVARHINNPTSWLDMGLQAYARNYIQGANAHIQQPTAEQWCEVHAINYEFVMDRYGRYTSCRIETYSPEADDTVWIDFASKQVIGEVEGKKVTAPIFEDVMGLEDYFGDKWMQLRREAA